MLFFLENQVTFRNTFFIVKQALEELRLNSYRTAVFYYYKRYLTESHWEFDRMLTY